MLQTFLVVILVAAATAYLTWALAPRTLRRRLVDRAVAWSDRSSHCPVWLRTRLVAMSATVASGCDACGGRSVRGTTHAHVAGEDP